MPIDTHYTGRNRHVSPWNWEQQPDGKWRVTYEGKRIPPYRDDYFPLPDFPSARTAQAVAEALRWAQLKGHHQGIAQRISSQAAHGCKPGECSRYTVEIAEAQAAAWREERDRKLRELNPGWEPSRAE